MQTEKVLLGYIVNSQMSFSRLMSVDLLGNTRMLLKKLNEDIMTVLAELYSRKKDLLEKYGTPDGKGLYKLEGESLKLFNEELNNLYQIPVSLDFEKIERKEISDVRMSAKDEILLSWLIKD